MGLGGLRISSDSSDIESDIDRDPSSATDSDGSPLSNPHPSFPVEILPHLYLGCAKDSTNLDVLEEYGIKYILNVTPNLPNLFENAGEFKYKQIPISDHWSQNLSQFFPEAISFIGKCSCRVWKHCSLMQLILLVRVVHILIHFSAADNFKLQRLLLSSSFVKLQEQYKIVKIHQSAVKKHREKHQILTNLKQKSSLKLVLRPLS